MIEAISLETAKKVFRFVPSSSKNRPASTKTIQSPKILECLRRTASRPSTDATSSTRAARAAASLASWRRQCPPLRRRSQRPPTPSRRSFPTLTSRPSPAITKRGFLEIVLRHREDQLRGNVLALMACDDQCDQKKIAKCLNKSWPKMISLEK